MKFFLLILVFLSSQLSRACTIFILTDTNRTLFFNNEDFSNPDTRLWFVPAGSNYFGCAYVGFNDGWAQGGVNTEGLAYDWVAGFDDQWTPGPDLKPTRGNPGERMLETCRTVQDAIAFYHAWREPAFDKARIMIADKSGASVIIGAHDGKLTIQTSNQCRGFGYGYKTLQKNLPAQPRPTLHNGLKILKSSRQKGTFGTKYSTIYDLHSGELFIYPVPGRKEFRFNLHAELAKGPHYYDIPKLQQQLTQPPQPLLLNMQRLPLDTFTPLPLEHSPHALRVQTIISNLLQGSVRAEDYTSEFWSRIKSTDFASETKSLGQFKSFHLLTTNSDNSNRTDSYRVEFERITLLHKYTFDPLGRIAAIDTEFFEPNP
ncbi:MAG: hypothetical protein SFY81_11195 [Verrucomicrobiota bacterium]|nr:hypothetical protein [Verrucomicrobiota bacterium]